MRLSQKTVYQMYQAMSMPGNFWLMHQLKDYGCHWGKKSKLCNYCFLIQPQILPTLNPKTSIEKLEAFWQFHLSRDGCSHAYLPGVCFCYFLQSWRCKRYGHRTGDKECPFFIKGNQKLEQFRVAHEDPMYDIIRENKRHEKDVRIQQLKRLLEDSTSDEDGSSSSSSECREKHKKKKKKEKHKKRKKEKKKKKKRKHKSSKSSESSDSQ
ncbi:uncharacterized protein isoform X4 [Castor canadensis]